jgi:dTDP-4-amino-4,6-dideoxygalactose transaminase
LQALRITGEVITTPYSFVATTHSLWWNGIKPVFVDIDPATGNIDPDKIEAAITPKTTAIMPVHVYGKPCDTQRIQEIADKYGLKIIYDAAHAFGVEVNGESILNAGDMSTLSFHATKVYNTIEGGAVCFADDALEQLLNDMKNFGIRGQESVAYVGGNAKMNEFQAAMGLCNLRHVDEEIEKRRKAVEHYRARLSDVAGIRLCEEQAGVKSNYAYFPVVFDGYKYTRDKVFNKLKENEIVARKYFYPLTNSFECYEGYPTAGAHKTPVAKYIADRVLTLPLYADLSGEEIDRICDVILG